MANTSPQAQRPATKDATSPATPVATFRYGNVSAAVFTNEVKTKDEKTADVFSASLRRSYRNGNGQWAHTHTLRGADLLPAAVALQKCYEFIQDERRS